MQKRILSYDFIRVCAILGVIAIHTENITNSPTNYLGGLSWWFANTIHSLAIVSVPLFVMLTGALQLNRRYLRYSYVLPKVFNQFVLPLVFWWIIFELINSYVNQIPLSFPEMIQKFILTDIGHLYFLQIIIGLYLSLPIVHKIMHSKFAHKISFTLFIAIPAIVYEYASFLLLKTYNKTNMFVIFLPFIFYLCCGYFLMKIQLNKKQWFAFFSVAVGLVGLLSFFTYKNTVAFNNGFTLFWAPSGGNQFWEPFSIPVILLSCVVFLLLNNIEVIFPNIFFSKKIQSLLLSISSTSFGIYIVHIFFLTQIDQLFHFSIQFITYPLWIYYIQRIIYVLAVSYFFVFLAQRIPLIKNIFGIVKKKE